MEKTDFIKIENVESENISNISDYQIGSNIHNFLFQFYIYYLIILILSHL